HRGIIEKLLIFNADVPIGEQRPEDIALIAPPFMRVGTDQLATATTAWRGFQQASPETWFGLLRKDLTALPYLRQAVSRLLDELPAVRTALSGSEMKLLKIIAGGVTMPLRAIASHRAGSPLAILDYWELGRTLDQLGRCEVPAVLGLR